ncbi:hypothetical protein CJ671_05735 [Aliarcobacter cryaerophilus]|uniref:Uncharacterized protein n=1 Tax=Aliarcobacter cryaerophilus TaxID=28198 RepID=A0A2S9STE6_9BACT|nr:hypothetical protein [Aliarcobacter cryaerophilus]PRM89857.1 hypothetical protein CJ671_05735 [Aliarcobacter cryaerophilus]
MERRDWSIKLLKELIYIDSLESYEKANNLVSWYSEYFSKSSINELDLEVNDLKILEELFYRNINFLKEQQKQAGEELKNIKKMKSFLKH